MKEKIFSWEVDLYYASLNGMFIGTDEDIERAQSVGTIYFGDVCGKHSSVDHDFAETKFKVVSEDRAVIEGMRASLPFGYDVMGYVSDKEAEYPDEEGED